MKYIKISYLLLGAIIIVFYILPFVILPQYAHLGIDDICRTNSSFQNFFEGLILWYDTHNGRYINAIFSLLPVYNLPVYRWTLTTGMVFFFLVVVYFVKNLSQLFGYDSKIKTFVFSLIFIVFLIGQLPSLYEMFYWYAASTVYLYSSTCLLLLLVQLYKIKPGNNNTTIVCAFLIVLITGSTEMLIPLVNLILLILFFVVASRFKKIPWNILLLNIVCWVSSLLVLLAPGSEKRQLIFSESGQIIFSLKNAFETALKILWNRINDPVVWVFIILVYFMSFINTKNVERKSVLFNPIILLIISGIAFISVVFVPFYALGFLDYGAGRIIDIIYFIFFILVLINSLNFFKFLNQKFDSNLLKKLQFIPLLLIVVFLSAVSILNQNYKGMYEDFSSNSYIRLDEDFNNRYELLKNTKKEIINIPPIKGTRIFTFNDIALGDSCFIQHVKSNYNSQVKEIIVRSTVNKDGHNSRIK